MSPPPSRSLRFWPLGLVLLLVLLLAVSLFDFGTRRDRGTTPVEPQDMASASDAIQSPPVVQPRAHAARSRVANGAPTTTSSRTPASSACAVNARKACHDGDVWWFDACGRPTDRVEACHGRACLGVGCAPESWPTDACGGVTPYGRCSGEVASACVAGRRVTVDCAAIGQRCVPTREGVRCLQHSALDCAPTDPAACDGDALRRCVDGRWESIDCALRLGHCSESGGSAHCATTLLPRASDQPLELCNRRDDDLDGRIDEDAACDPVALVAFVAGEVPAAFDARLQRELAILNRELSPLSFRWAKTVRAPAPPRVSPESFDALARTLSLSESRLGRDRLRAQRGAPSDPLDPGLDFYIPVLFVEEIETVPPTAGQGSLPNSTCGGVRVSDRPAPPYGLVVVSAARQPDTLAHELGHYLGLCHTHEELAVYGPESGAPDCERSGDGICDTPWDPGPERCALLSSCGTDCVDPAAQPDASNLMSYYMPCRSGLSAQQLAVVEQGLSLRRGWFRCLDPSECRCLPGAPSDCPAEMSCQPTDDDGTGVCRMDGPSLPGAPCEGASDCSDGSVCLGAGAGSARVSRCVRACGVPDTRCACVDIGLPFQVCSEDL